MYRKLLFLTIIIVGIFFAIAVFAQTCPHIYEGINCGANWYCNGCQTTCKSCPGGGDPTGATELNYVSCTCGCPSGQIVCSGACTTAPACSTPTREQNNSSCNGCGVCKSGYAADPANPNPPSPCLKAAYIDYPNTGYFQTSGDLKSTGGDLYLASGKAIRIDGAGTTILSVANSIGTALDMVLKGGLLVYDTMTSPSQGPGSINAEKLCIQGNCRTTWPEAVSAFVDEGNVGFGPTAVLGTNDNTPLSFEVNNIGRIYIDTAGNVGIGTTMPGTNSSLLEIKAATPRIYINASGTNPELDFGNGTDHWAIYRDTATDQLRFWRTNDRMAITSSGNVGLGTLSPASKLSILGNLAVGAAYVGLVGPGDGAIIQGNVGIGTTAPAYKLDVTGQANATQLCIAGVCRGTWPAPVGDDKWVQFNDGGNFGGSSGLIYDKASYSLLLGGTIGVNGIGNATTIGVSAIGSSAGAYFKDKDSGDSGYAYVGFGNYGIYSYGSQVGLYGQGGSQGVYGNGTDFGVYGTSNYTGVYGSGNSYGVFGFTSTAMADAGFFSNASTSTYARLGHSTWGGYFGGNVGVTGNLTVGSGSGSDNDSIYFDDGTADHYIQWYDTGGEFRFSHPIFSYGWLSGTQLTVRSGGYNQAVDASNAKSIAMRHMSTYGLLETQSTTVNAGNLVLRSHTAYPANYVEVQDELRVTSSLTVVGNATVTGKNICLQDGTNCPGGGGISVLLQASTPGTPQTGNLNISGTGIFGNLTIGSLSGILKATSGVVGLGASTSDLAEGANLYYTDSRARNAISAGAGPVNYTPATGAISFSSPLAVLYGGTGGSATPTAGGVAYGNGSAYAFTSAGSSGQFLQSNGAGAPTWATIPASVGGSGTANYLAKFTGAATVGNSLIYDSGTNVQIVSGNLGIGWSPIYKLDVNGTSYLGGATTVAGTLGVSSNATISGTLGVSNAATFSNNATISGALGVGGQSATSGYGVRSQGSTAGGYFYNSTNSSYGYIGYGTYGGYFQGTLYASGNATLNNSVTVGEDLVANNNSPSGCTWTAYAASVSCSNGQFVTGVRISGTTVSAYCCEL